MPRSREQLAIALRGIAPETYQVIDSPILSIGEADPEVVCYLHLVRQTLAKAPTNPYGNYLETFECWVVSTNKEPADAENELDDRLAESIGVIDQIDWLTWSVATRRVHESGYPSYMIQLNLISDREKE